MYQVQSSKFMALWGHKLDDEQKEACQGCSFFLCTGGGFALQFRRKLCMVVMNVGESGGNHMRLLVKWLKENRFKSVIFYYRKNSPASAFAKYAKARRWVSRDKYDNGEPAHLALVRLNGKRFGNGKP
jgi:hypothetical protein